MAKRRRPAADGTSPSTADAGDQYSDCRDSIQAAVRKQQLVYNKDAKMLTHEQTLWLCGGIALPAIALRYLLHQDAFPMGRTITLSGLFGSNKTSLAFEIARWVLTYRGLGWYNDVERKDSPDMRACLMQRDPMLLDYIEINPCTTQQHWQGGVTSQFTTVMSYAEKDKGRFRTLGTSIVDSVAAAEPKEEAEKFLSEHGGAGKRSHPAIALYNSKWMTNIAHLVNSGPFVLLLIQHSSEVQDPRTPGIVTRKQKGGMEVAFAKTTAFEMTRIGNIKETANGGGVNIQIECSKNALGPARRRIRVPARWDWVYSADAGKRQQRYWWDWHHASIELLLSISTMDGRKAQWKELSSICDLHKMSGGRVWSRALGIPESSPVRYAEASQILEYEHPELLPGLYDVLHIERRPIMAPGGDLRALWDGKVPIPAVPAVVPYPRSQTTLDEDADDE